MSARLRNSIFLIIFLIIIFVFSYALTWFLVANYTADGKIDNIAYNSLMYIFRILVIFSIFLAILFENKKWGIGLTKLLFNKNDIKKYSLSKLLLMKLGNLFLIIIIAFFVFSMLEFISRAVSPSISAFDRIYNEGITRDPNPYIVFKGKPNATTNNWEFNKFGYRGKAPSVKKDSSEYRIFLLGGSTVVSGNSPTSTLIEREFSRNGYKNVKVYNWGVVASVSNMAIARIVYEISDHSPDLIIFFNGANDMIHPFYGDPRPGYPVTFFIYRNNVFFKRADEYPGISLLAYNSNLLRIFFRKYFMNKFTHIDRVREDVNYNTDQWRDEIARSYIKSLLKAGKISKAFGSEFIAFFQPIFFYKDKLSDKERQIDFDESKEHHLYLRKRIRSLAGREKERLKFIDLSDFYDNIEEQVFIDLVHTNQESKGLIAKEIYKHLIRNFNIAR